MFDSLADTGSNGLGLYEEEFGLGGGVVLAWLLVEEVLGLGFVELEGSCGGSFDCGEGGYNGAESVVDLKG